MRCADCIHYETAGDTNPPAGYGHCSRWHAGYDVVIFDVARNEAWIEDDEGWGNVVGPEFGCVLFEQSAR